MMALTLIKKAMQQVYPTHKIFEGLANKKLIQIHKAFHYLA